MGVVTTLGIGIWNHPSSQAPGPQIINNAPISPPGHPVASSLAGPKCSDAHQGDVCVELNSTAVTGPRTDNLDTKPNSSLAVRIEYENKGTADVHDVILKVTVPDQFVQAIDGSTRVWNSVVPQGGPVESNELSRGGVNVGAYAPNGNVYLEQLFLVRDVSRFTCGANAFEVTVVAQVGNTTTQDAATARVERQCGPGA